MSVETRPSYARLAAEAGVTKDTMWKRLRGTGTGDLPCVGRDGKRRPGRIDREAIEARNAEIVRLRAGGMKHLDIARALGCSRATVENCLRARWRRDRYKGVV